MHQLARAECETLVTGSVGPGAAKELIEFTTQADLPDPADVLDGRVEFVHEAHRLDRSMAILSSCAALCASKQVPDRKRRAAKLWTIMAQTLNGAEDVAVPAARALCRAGFITSSEAQPMLQKLEPFLAAAGIKTA